MPPQLTNPYVIALGIPVVVILCGALAKKLVRGTPLTEVDFFLGVELTMATLTATLVHVYDLARRGAAANPAKSVSPADLIGAMTFLVLSLFILLWIMAMHQDWRPRDDKRVRRALWLGVMANLIGVGLFATFILLVKKV